MNQQIEIGTNAPDEPGKAVATTDPTGVNALVEMALQMETVNVDALERLIAMRERIEDREARKAYFDALGAFQNECPPILKMDDGLKTGKGASAKTVSWYAKLPRILAIAGPVLRKHGFSWRWDTQVSEQSQRVVCELTHVLGHSETSEFTAPVTKVSPLTRDHQDNAGAVTYGMRYSLVLVTGIVTADVDNDGAGPPPGTVSAEQAMALEATAKEVGANLTRFLDVFGVKTFVEIPEHRHAEAVSLLEQKRAENARR